MLNCDCYIAILETISVDKRVQACLRMYLQNVFTNHIYIYIYIREREDLALNNLQWFICHKTQPNQTFTLRSHSILSPVTFQI